MSKLAELNERLIRNNVGVVYEMNELDKVLGGLSPTEVIYRISEGGFNVKDNYFKVNGRGNLDSYESIEDLERLYGDVK